MARDRLLDWLTAKIHHRVILVLADAGYGKTTLLADFSRRTRLRTLWYRLDDDDRDWISFLSHLVAAGREHDPGFAPTTADLLTDLAMGGPTREAATEVFLRELPSIAGQGAVLILDDFHLVDESPDVRQIVREIVTRAPERLTLAFVSRRAPAIPLARLRATGEVAEIGTDDLRFDTDETARLFSETYGRALEPDVLADLAARTEGWAASLQLVHAALRDRSPVEIRRFVRGLSGADQELYDYLAEAVVGDLPDDLQRFLMCTSILQVVTPDLAAVAAELEPDDVARLTAAAERLTLLSRPSRAARSQQRFHPLVREFLEARLRATSSDAAVSGLHLRVANAAAGHDWRVAAYHYREAGDHQSVATTIAAAIPEIMGSGQYTAAADEINWVPEGLRAPGLALVTSRVHLQRREFDDAAALSRLVLSGVEPGSGESDYALLNLVAIYLQTGLSNDSRPFARMLRDTTSSQHLRLIADGTGLMIDASADGSIEAMSRHLTKMADQQRGVHPHFFGVTMLNLSIIASLRDDLDAAVDLATEAISALEDTSSRLELSAALMAKGYALTLMGSEGDAKTSLSMAAAVDETEVMLERGDLADSFLNPEAAQPMIHALRVAAPLNNNAQLLFLLQSAWFYGRRGRHVESAAAVAELESHEEGFFLGQASIRRVTKAYVAIAADSPMGKALAEDALRACETQEATRWTRVAQLLISYLGSEAELNEAIRSIGAVSPWNLTFVADLICERLDEINEIALEMVTKAAHLHPGRWKFELRKRLVQADPTAELRAARLLESIGDRSDVPVLRGYARRNRKLPGAQVLGRELARRLADRAMVEDQGRVSILVGPRENSRARASEEKSSGCFASF